MFSVILVAVRRTSASCDVSFRWASDLRMEQYCAINAWTDLGYACFPTSLNSSASACSFRQRFHHQMPSAEPNFVHCYRRTCIRLPCTVPKQWLHFRITFGGISKHKIQSMADTINIWRMVDDTLLYACIVFFRSMLIIFLFNFLVNWLGGPQELGGPGSLNRLNPR